MAWSGLNSLPLDDQAVRMYVRGPAAVDLQRNNRSGSCVYGRPAGILRSTCRQPAVQSAIWETRSWLEGGQTALPQSASQAHPGRLIWREREGMKRKFDRPGWIRLRYGCKAAAAQMKSEARCSPSRPGHDLGAELQFVRGAAAARRLPSHPLLQFNFMFLSATSSLNSESRT